MKRFLFTVIISVLALSSCKQEIYHTLSVAAFPTEGGTVTPSSESVLQGERVSIAAAPSEEYLFGGWSGDATGSDNPLSVVMDSDKSIIANFIKKTYTLSISVEGSGRVEEKLVGTKTDYESGSIVQLTAVPAEYWLFDHWEGDVSAKDNPVTLDVTGAKSVKAVFVKPRYVCNVKIEGPGVVDEFLEETKSGLEAGTRIRLRATPSEGAVFKGWSGGVSGTDNEVVVTLDSEKVIVATFASRPNKQFELPDLHLPTSLRKGVFYAASDFTSESCNYCALDYDLDGYVDIVTCYGSGYQDKRVPIQFFKGQADGSYVLDEVNSNRFDGLICWRKSLYGDYNGDGLPDICFVGHGWDEEPWPGEYPVLLLSSPSGEYTEHRFEELIGYYHGSAAGDIDNDGDLDIILIDHSTVSKVLENDGHGNMTVHSDRLNVEVIDGGFYTCELFDINHDGCLDLFVGGHEHEGQDWHMYTNQTCVFWGNGESYNNDNYVRLPAFERGWGVTLDYIFYDLDGDGQEEIINVRTGDGFGGQKSYVGWNFQIVSLDGTGFHDVTRRFITQGGTSLTDTWLIKICIEEVDGEICLVALDATARKRKLFRLTDGVLERIELAGKDETCHSNGICLYSDAVGVRGEHANLGYREDSYSGNTSIRFHDWPMWNGWSVDYADWQDFSALEKGGYCLEFAIKNADPDLYIAFSFETRLQTEPWYFPSYEYGYVARNHKCDGSWEVIRIPLNSLNCGDEWSGYYWNTIKTLNIMPAEYHGIDFLLDEIRIRKIVDL